MMLRKVIEHNLTFLVPVQGYVISITRSPLHKNESLRISVIVLISQEARKLFNVMVKYFRQRGTYFEDPVMAKFDEMASTVMKKCLQIQHKTKVPKVIQIVPTIHFMYIQFFLLIILQM